MGYYANGYGYFEVKDTDTIVDDFAKAMTDIEDETCNYKITLWENDMAIDFAYHGKYHEEDVREVLDVLTPLVEDGSMMEFSGEDGSLWAFILENGTWVEKQGYVVYR